MAAAAPSTIVLCVVTNGRQEVSLACAVSMLRLQNALMMSPSPLRADMHFVESLDDALNVLHRHADAAGALIADHGIGFDAEFAFRALRSGLPLVAGTYPLPTVDWERVKQAPENEDPGFWGNVYNVTPTGRFNAQGYARVSAARLGLVWVSKAAVAEIARKHPELATDDGYVPFALAGVYDGKRLDGNDRFLQLYDGEIWADIERPATSTGPLEFGGCVGSRQVLR